MHSLDGAYEQVRGAREHLDSLKPEIDVFAKTIANEVVLKYQKGTVNYKGKQHNVPIGTATAPVNRPAPPRASRLIGDVVQSLRKALDYLVYELACFDTKGIVDMTQFVIVDSIKDFEKQKWHLRGLTGEHIALFEHLQPYHGHNWLKLIEILSNPDKHKTLTAVRQSAYISLNDSNTEAILAGKQVDVNSYASIQISFNDGESVIESLEQLIKEVTHVLDVFKSEFK
jgi:hypothetical protein